VSFNFSIGSVLADFQVESATYKYQLKKFNIIDFNYSSYNDELPLRNKPKIEEAILSPSFQQTVMDQVNLMGKSPNNTINISSLMNTLDLDWKRYSNFFDNMLNKSTLDIMHEYLVLRMEANSIVVEKDSDANPILDFFYNIIKQLVHVLNISLEKQNNHAL
jgi:hypothetical protein